MVIVTAHTKFDTSSGIYNVAIFYFYKLHCKNIVFLYINKLKWSRKGDIN